jgi:hypothetical protein
MTAELGNRQALVRRGALRGALGGLVWSLPVGLLCAGSVFLVPATPQAHWDLAGQTLLWTVLTWVSIAAAAGAQKAREAAMTAEHRKVMKGYIFRAALQSTLFSTPVAAFAVWTTWGYGPGGAVITGVMIMGVWVGCATAVGRGRGLARVAALQRQERLEMDLFVLLQEFGSTQERWDPATLAERRKALEAAVARKFGPPADAFREKVRAWDQDRITGAGRKLPGAGRLEDIDD